MIKIAVWIMMVIVAILLLAFSFSPVDSAGAADGDFPDTIKNRCEDPSFVTFTDKVPSQAGYDNRYSISMPDDVMACWVESTTGAVTQYFGTVSGGEYCNGGTCVQGIGTYHYDYGNTFSFWYEEGYERPNQVKVYYRKFAPGEHPVPTPTPGISPTPTATPQDGDDPVFRSTPTPVVPGPPPVPPPCANLAFCLYIPIIR